MNLSDTSIDRIRSAVVDIYGDQEARTTVGEDGLVTYDWGDSGPVVKSEILLDRLVTNEDDYSGDLTYWAEVAGDGLKIDTEAWEVSANRDADFTLSARGDGPTLSEVLRARFNEQSEETTSTSDSSSSSSTSTVDTTDPVDGARSHREVLTPEESGGLVDEPVDISQSDSSSVSSTSETSSPGLLERALAVGAVLVGIAVAVFGGD